MARRTDLALQRFHLGEDGRRLAAKWNHRLILHLNDVVTGGAPWVAIHEVEYDSGKPLLQSAPIVMVAKSRRELIWLGIQTCRAVKRRPPLELDHATGVLRERFCRRRFDPKRWPAASSGTEQREEDRLQAGDDLS